MGQTRLLEAHVVLSVYVGGSLDSATAQLQPYLYFDHMRELSIM